jgi:hypothetical protein
MTIQKHRELTGTMVLLLIAGLFISNLPFQGVAQAGVFGDSSKSAGAAQSFPVIDLPAPKAESERTYLGLSKTGDFRLGQIKTQILIIEMFSTYCSFCQRLAPQMNVMYNEIERRSDLKDKVKIIAIGLGDRAYEVKNWKEKFHVPFPIFDDPYMRVGKELLVTATPTIIVVKTDEKGGQEKFYTHPGPFEDGSKFLADIIVRSGLTFK